MNAPETQITLENGPIIAGWDGSPQARDAIALAGVLARELDAPVQIVHVGPNRIGIPNLAPAVQYEAEDLLARAPADLLGGVAHDGTLVAGRSPAEGLLRVAAETGARLVVLGSTHHGAVGRVIPGTVADHLLHGSPCGVAIAPRGYADDPEARSIRVVAAAFDGSPESRAAVALASDIALRAQAALRVISVATMPNVGWGAPGIAASMRETMEERIGRFRHDLDDLVSRLPSAVRADGRLLDGQAAPQIAAECEKGVDLLVAGSRGYGALGRVMLGSVSSELIRNVSCPTLVVPQAAAKAFADGDATPEAEPAPA